MFFSYVAKPFWILLNVGSNISASPAKVCNDTHATEWRTRPLKAVALIEPSAAWKVERFAMGMATPVLGEATRGVAATRNGMAARTKEVGKNISTEIAERTSAGAWRRDCRPVENPERRQALLCCRASRPQGPYTLHRVGLETGREAPEQMIGPRQNFHVLRCAKVCVPVGQKYG